MSRVTSGKRVEKVTEGDCTTVRTFLNDKLHSFNGRPAVVETKRITVAKSWYKDGVPFRDGDKPAYEVWESRGGAGWQFGRQWLDVNGLPSRAGGKPDMVNTAVNFIGNERSVIVSKYWHENNRLHRDGDKPAVVRLSKRFNADVLVYRDDTYEYYASGERHRGEDLPAAVSSIVSYDASGDHVIRSTFVKKFFKNDDLHRDGDKPAVKHFTYFYENGKRNLEAKLEEFFVEGKLHREGGKPAYIQKYYADFYLEGYFYNGVFHRAGEPALIRTSDSSENMMVWMLDGELHNEGDEPTISYLMDEEYWYSFFSKSLTPEIIIFREKQFLVSKIHELDASIDDGFLMEYPVEQVRSILNTLSPIRYVNKIHYRVDTLLNRISM